MFVVEVVKRLLGSPQTAQRRALIRIDEPLLSFGGVGDRFVRITSLDFLG
jgi:hypothetical protein